MMRLIAAALLLVGCTQGAGTSSFGSPERTAHFLTCLPVALRQAQTTAQQLEATKDGTSTSQVLDGINQRLTAGDVSELAIACGPYLADLAIAGNVRAREIQQEIRARGGQ